MSYTLEDVPLVTSVSAYSVVRKDPSLSEQLYNLFVINNAANRAAFTFNQRVILRLGGVSILEGFIRHRSLKPGQIVLSVTDPFSKLLDGHVEWKPLAETGGIYEYGGGAGGGGVGSAIMISGYADVIAIEIIGAMVVEDGQSYVWDAYEDTVGNFDITISDDSTEKRTGADSLRAIIGAVAPGTGYAILGVRLTLDAVYDITDYTKGLIWLYGANSGEYFQIWLRSGPPGYAQYSQFAILDNFASWPASMTELDLSSPTNQSGGWDPTAFGRIDILFGCDGTGVGADRACQLADTWRTDRFYFIKLHDIAQCPTTVIDVKIEDKFQYDALVDIAKILGVDLWCDGFDVYLGTKGGAFGALTTYYVIKSEQGDDFANVLICQAVDNTGAPITSTAENAASIALYDRIEAPVETFNEAFTQATLDAYATNRVAELAESRRAELLAPESQVVGLEVGDTVTLNRAWAELVGIYRVMTIKERTDGWTVLYVSNEKRTLRRTMSSDRKRAEQSHDLRTRQQFRAATYVGATDGSGHFKDFQKMLDAIT